MKRLGLLLLCLFIPLFIGGLAGFINIGGASYYQTLAKPPLSPPGWVFPPVWTLLYGLMGLSSYFAAVSEKGRPRPFKILYGTTLLLNFIWPFLFFGAEKYLLSFIWIILMWTVGFALCRELFLKSTLSAILFLPYMVWITFAAYLCYGVAMLN